MVKSKFLPILAGAAALGALAFGGPAARADTFNLTSCHITPIGGGAPDCGGLTSFGTVTLTQSGANVNFDVLLSDSNRFVETGSADQQLFKFNATGVAVGDIVNEKAIAVAPFTPNPNVTPVAGFTGAFNGDGTGNFAFGIACGTDGAATPAACNRGSAPNMNEVTFTVNNSLIADFTSAADLTFNGSGNLFVADILLGSGTQSGQTGPVDAVPAPVLGHGLFVLLAVGGVLFGGKLLENLKKHRLQAA